MTALRADGFGGQIEFDGERFRFTREGWRATKLPEASAQLAEVLRFDHKPATSLLNGHFRLVIPSLEVKLKMNDCYCVEFAKKSNQQFEELAAAVAEALEMRGELSAEEISQIEDKYDAIRAEAAEAAAADLADKQAKALDQVEELRRKATGAVYAGHIVDYKGYRYGLGIKRPIAGAGAHFESGADRSRPTLTRIGAGALLAGPVGAIAGGMFKKDKSKAYVTIVFPDGASVIIDGPVKDEKKMRRFAQQVNQIAQAEQQRAGVGPEVEVVMSPSPADQLLKLKELHTAGVLTDAQYEEKSAPLIAAL